MNKETHISIVIGNCNPFRIVEREGDNWSPSLEEINERHYDYIKLNRVSTFIDIGIAPYSLGVGYDGSLILPLTKEFASKEQSLLKFNETLGYLLLGGVYSEAIQPDDISYGALFFNGYSKMHGGGAGSISKFHQAIRLKMVGDLDVIKLINPLSVSKDELDKAYLRGKEIFKELESLSPNLLLDGTSYFVKSQWAESLIFLWTSVEQLVNQIWNQKVIRVEIEGVIEGRKSFLKDFRNWTVSTQIETLFQKGLIPFRVYKPLNYARKARNAFIHDGKPLDETKVKHALDGVFMLISLIVSNYEDTNLLDEQLSIVSQNQRGELLPKRKEIQVTHWLKPPPLPGDEDWGDEEYEIIEDLVLKPLQKR